MRSKKTNNAPDEGWPGEWHAWRTDEEIRYTDTETGGTGKPDGLSRRSVMKAAGALGVGALGVGAGASSFIGSVRATSGQVSFGDNVHVVNPDANGDQDVEPQIASDAYGTLYTASIRGAGAGSDIWKSTDHGESWDYLGQPDGLPAVTDTTGVAPGGGDIALDIGTPYPGSSGNVYVSSLYLGSIYFSTSTDGGETWNTVNPVSSDIPGVDRQWVTAEGQNTVYMSYHDVETENIDVVKSTDSGGTFVPVSPAIPPTQEGTFVAANTGLSSSIDKNLLGNILVDDNTGDLYQVWAGASNAQTTDLDTVYMSVSEDGGLTWTVNQVYTDPQHTVSNIFPVVAIDDASNIYAVWSNNHNIYYSASPDRGATWRTPVQADLDGWGTNTSVFPWAVAGDEGVLDITWYATSAKNNTVEDAKWKVYFNQVTDALSDPQVLRPVTASDHVIHTGDISEGGFGGNGDRSLADVFYMCLDPEGRAHIAYTDDHDADLPSQTYTASQVDGPRAYADPQTFPLQFYVTGTRSDDGSVFTGGQTDQIDLSVTPSQDAPVRDVVPTEWNVLTGVSNDVDHVETDSNAGVKYVYFTETATANDETDYTYFVEAPSGATQTGTYNFGPIEVKPAEYWVQVDGTGDTNTVEGQST